MADLPIGEPGAPYTSRWSSLKADNRIWADDPGVHPGGASPDHGQGALLLLLGGASESSGQVVGLGKWWCFFFLWFFLCVGLDIDFLVQGQHYTMALIDRLLDAGRVIEH